MSKPWVIYTRVSTEEQGDRVSPDAQREACLGLLTTYGYEIGETIVDEVSGKDLNRPGARRLIALIENRAIAGFIVWKFDRLTRDVEDISALLKKLRVLGVQVISVMERIDTTSTAGRMMAVNFVNFAQYERETIGDRTRLAMRKRIAEGGWVGGPIPAGCRVVGAEGHRMLERDPDRAPIVQQAWTRVLEGDTLLDVARYLDDAGIPPPRFKSRTGRQWMKSSVRGLLLNSRVVGILVNQEIFLATHAALARRTNPKARQRHGRASTSVRIWPLAGLTYCAICDATLIGISAAGRGGIRYPYLRCTGRVRRGRTSCDSKDLPAAEWEAAVMKALGQVITSEVTMRPRLQAEHDRLRALEKPANAERDRLILERDKLRKRLAKVLDLVETDAIPTRAAKDRLTELQLAIETQGLAIARIDGQLAATAMLGESVDRQLEQLRLGLERLTTAHPMDQAAALRALVARVKLGRGRPIELEIYVPGDPGSFKCSKWLPITAAERTKIHLSIPVAEQRGSHGRWLIRLVDNAY